MSDADGDSSYMYEQGELEPSPEAEHHVKGRHLSLSPHSQETIDDDIIIIKDRDDLSEHDEHGDELDIKPPQSHAGKKDKSHKHRHKEERRREKERRSRIRRDRIERSDRDTHDNRAGFPSHVEVPRGHHTVHSHERRDFKEIAPQHPRNPVRGRVVEREHKPDRERVGDVALERRLRDESKEAREVRKRQESLDERDRLERLERERQRERKMREERIRKLEERAARAKRKEEERRNIVQSRVEDRSKRSRNERSVRDRSHSEDRRHRRDIEKNSDKLRLKKKEPTEQRVKVIGPHTPPEEDFHHHKQDESEEEVEEESEEEEEEDEEEVEEEEEEEEEMKEEVEGETPESESISESDSDTSSESESDSSAQHSEVGAGEIAVVKHEKVKSKFDHSEDESETESPLQIEREDLDYIEASPPPSPVEEVSHLPLYFPAIQGCRNVEEFHCLNRIEEGTYGVVYRARDKKTNEIVALKRLKMEKEKEGFPITALREINTLLKSQHLNIVTVREIVVGSNMDKIYLVMDYVEHDLKRLMESMKSPFLSGEVKTLMQQLLRAVIHLHDNWILHRDLKTSNLLLSHHGILKVGDFGLAREYGSPLKHYTPIVVTLWYRAPELLLGIKQYSCPVDLWSVGCIFAELLTMKALWPGKSEIDQLNRIFKDLGTPNKKIWPGVEDLPVMKKCTFTDYAYNTLRNRFGSYFSDMGFDLLNKFLTYCPQRRITAEDALKHEYFKEAPLPVDPSMFPTWPAKSEQQPRKHQSSPKPPSGGKAYSKLLDDEESMGFHMSNAVKGASAQGPGFSLKF